MKNVVQILALILFNLFGVIVEPDAVDDKLGERQSQLGYSNTSSSTTESKSNGRMCRDRDRERERGRERGEEVGAWRHASSACIERGWAAGGSNGKGSRSSRSSRSSKTQQKQEAKVVFDGEQEAEEDTALRIACVLEARIHKEMMILAESSMATNLASQY
jgi:hypothetical protein